MRMAPGFNEANLFVPHSSRSQHAVEPVLDAADPHAQRISFTAWMGVPSERRHPVSPSTRQVNFGKDRGKDEL